MNSRAQVRGGGATATARPGLVDVGSTLAVAAAAVNAVIGILVAVQASSTTLPVQPALVAVVVVISLVYSAAVVVLAGLFRGGRTWARGALLAVSALSLLTLFAPNAFNLLVIVLLLASVWVLHRRGVTDWMRAVRAATPG